MGNYIKVYSNEEGNIYFRFPKGRLARTKDEIIEDVKKDINEIEYLHTYYRADRDVGMAAVKTDGWALQHLSPKLKGDYEIALEAVKTNITAIQYVSEELLFDREFIKECVIINGSVMKYLKGLYCSDLEIVKLAVESNPETLNFLPQNISERCDVLMAIKDKNGFLSSNNALFEHQIKLKKYMDEARERELLARLKENEVVPEYANKNKEVRQVKRKI